MSQMFVMRRANGDLFTEAAGGKLMIPVWSTEEALERYKERNPELITFLPTRLTQSLIEKIKSTAGEDAAELLLVSEDDPDADLDEGTALSWEEVLLKSNRSSQPAQARA